MLLEIEVMLLAAEVMLLHAKALPLQVVVKILQVTDFPLFGIEVVGTSADIVDKTEGKVGVGHNNIATRCGGWKR